MERAGLPVIKKLFRVLILLIRVVGTLLDLLMR